MIQMAQERCSKMIALLPDLELDLLAGILYIRYASHMASVGRNKDALKQPLWDIVEKARPGEHVNAIIAALQQIAPDFPWLNGLIDSVQAIKPEESTVKEFIELLSNIDCASVPIAQLWQYQLGRKVWKAEKLSGHFYTPMSVVRMMAELLELQQGSGSVYDPCCGSGAMLLQAFPEQSELEFYGQTADKQTYMLCQTNAFLHNQQINLGEKSANVFAEDLHSGQKFDYILSNPPFNTSAWYSELRFNDPRWQYGIPPRSNANFAWLQHIISHLSCCGHAAVILPNGALTTSVEAERHIRKNILCAGLVEAVIALPPGLFYTTKIPCSLWLLDQSRDSKRDILLADARHLQLRETAGRHMQNIAQLRELLLRHRAGKLQRKTNWYAAVPLEEIALRNYNLSPNLYTQASCIPISDIQKNRSRFKRIIDLLSPWLAETDLFNPVQQWKTVKPSSRWEKMFLLELYEAFGGITKPKRFFGHGVPMVDVKTVIHHLFVPDTLPAAVDADRSEINKYQIRAGDILLNRTSETIEELACGCVAPKEGCSVYSSYVKRLRLMKEGFLQPFYMAGYLRSAIYRQEVKKVSTVYTTRVNINMEQLSNIAVYFPEPDMQQKLGDTLFAVSQFQKKKPDKELAELLKEFIELLIEQYITYPVLRIQNREDGNT